MNYARSETSRVNSRLEERFLSYVPMKTCNKIANLAILLCVCLFVFVMTTGCDTKSEEPTKMNTTALDEADDISSPADKRVEREREFQAKIKDPLLTPVENPESGERVSAEVGYGDKSDVEIMRENPRPPRIAALGPLTGELNYYGKEALNGAELASEELDAAGGVNGVEYELLVVDSKGSIAGTRQAIEALLEYSVLAIIGAGTGEVSFSANKSINENQIIKISAGSRRRLGDTGPYNYRNSLDDTRAVASLVSFIKKERPWRRFAIFSSVVDDYSVQQSAYFKVALLNAGMTISHELFLWGAAMTNVSAEETSIDAQVSEMVKNPPDAVVFTGNPVEGADLLNAMRAKGINAPLIGSEDLIDQAITSLGAKGAGTLVYGGFNADSSEPLVRRFVDAYAKKYGQPPSRLAALAYDSFNMVVEATRQAPSLRPSHVRLALDGIKNYRGVTGPTTINDVGESLKEPFIFELKSEGDKAAFVAIKEPF